MAIIKQLKAPTTGLAEEDLQEEALVTAVKLMDLNHDGRPEVVAQGPLSLCSATGNCPFWVFRKGKDGYRLILKSFGQTFTLAKQHSGFKDIIVGMHGSAHQTTLFAFRFIESGYRQVGCYEAHFDWIAESQGAKRKDPQITECAGAER